MMTPLERRFNAAMLAIYDAAKRLKPPYTPADFRRMVTDKGGRGTADQLLATPNPSSGFTQLLIRGKENLKLSVEYLVLEEPWRELFTIPQLIVAKERLESVECPLPPGAGEYITSLSTEPAADFPLPEEVPSDIEAFPEGSVRRIVVNAYERNSEARARCIAHYGPTCVVCGFNFGEVYGPVASGPIHVHHLTPLATRAASYEVDPIRDLRPVCANCHSVIHLGGSCRTPAEVQALMRVDRRG